MKIIQFNPYKKSSLELSFDCKKCGNRVYGGFSIEYRIPFVEECEGGMPCWTCDEYYDIKVWKTKPGKGYAEIEALTEEDEVSMNVFQFSGLDYILDPSIHIMDFKENFYESISNINELNSIEIRDPLVRNYQKNLLHVSVITAMEAYLSDVCVYLIKNRKKFRRNFLKVYQIEKDKLQENLEGRSFHNLEKTRDLYKRSFKIDIPEIEHLIPYVAKRHNIVHRNGVKKEDEEISEWKREIRTTKEDIKKLVVKTTKFVQDLDKVVTDL